MSTIAQAFDASTTYYDDWMRMALPNFDEIFSVAVGLIPFGADDPISVLDLGAGTGLFSWHVLGKFPAARFTLCDLAPKMLEVAQRRFQPYGDQFTYRVEDYRFLESESPFDLVISSLSIHHLTDEDKAALFQSVYRLLKPGGLFINVDQIKGPSDYWQHYYWDQWLQRVRRKGAAEDQIAASVKRRKDYDQEASLPAQLLWLNQAGFAQVDCIYKNAFIGVFCAIKAAGVKWDAADYAKSSSAQQKWARELIAKLHLTSSERVLDLGCGDGKVTAELAALAASVLGVDNSPEMVALAESTHQAANLRFMQADARSLPFDGEFDVVFSNATLHWVKDHAPALAGIRRALAPGGRILLQMGGYGNAAGVVTAVDTVRSRLQWAAYFDGFEFPYGFYAPGEYTAWLVTAGLIPLRVELIPKETIHADRAAFEGWFRTTWIPYTQRIPESHRAAFITEAVDTYLEQNPSSNGEVRVLMIRLEVEATR